MEVTYSSETSVDYQLITRHYIPEDRTLHVHRCGGKQSSGFLLGLYFDPEDGGDMFLRNVG
jgi:hypothetical protein